MVPETPGFPRSRFPAGRLEPVPQKRLGCKITAISSSAIRRRRRSRVPLSDMKHTPRLLWFVTRFAVLGLAAAFLVVWWRPELISPGEPWAGMHVNSGGAPATASEASLSYAPAVNRAGPAVVNIHAAKVVEERRNPLFSDPMAQRLFGESGGLSPRRFLERTLGSGVIVSSDGYILTNHHVIKGAEQVQVALHDGRVLPAGIVGTDPESDLAVLQVEGEELPAIAFNGDGPLAVGDIVLAIGNPYGIGQTVTMGIVSATGRSELNVATYENFIQTDAAINIGNSGGALINTRGEMVGINTAVLNRQSGAQGISFAIPAEIAEEVFRSIVEHGRVVRGWLGIVSAELVAAPGDAREPDTRGIRVTAVMPEGPAAVAGIQPGDVILTIAGEPVRDTRSLQSRVGGLEPGTRVTISGLRNQRPFETQVVLSERPTPG